MSAPTRVARTTSRPYVLMVAPATSVPGPTSTGTGSPVSIDASTAERPSSTTPSVAIFSPGRTTNRSPGWTRSTGTTTSCPSRRSRASFAPSSRSARIAAPARPRARVSRNRPRRISVVITAPTSKYVSASSSATSATTDHVQAASVPIETSVSIVAARMARVRHRGAVERPAGPEDDGGREREGEPLPPVELECGDHRESGERCRQRGATASRIRSARRPLVGGLGACLEVRAVPGRRHRVDEVGDRRPARVVYETLACSVARLTDASTPSRSFSDRSTRAAQAAHVIPSIARRTLARGSSSGAAVMTPRIIPQGGNGRDRAGVAKRRRATAGRARGERGAQSAAARAPVSRPAGAAGPGRPPSPSGRSARERRRSRPPAAREGGTRRRCRGARRRAWT